MKIIDVKTILLTGPCTLDPYLSESRKLRSAAFILIETDLGITGLGETYAGYFIPEAVPSIVEFFKPILQGNDVDDIPGLWKRMYHSGNFWCRVGLGTIVLAGIEAALWDLKGKILGKPVYQLLIDSWKAAFKNSRKDVDEFSGHNRILCYATGGPSNYPLEKLISKIEYYKSLGFNGVKVGAGSFTKEGGSAISNIPQEAADFEASKVEKIRKEFGNELCLMLDAHMGNHSKATWTPETAMAVARQLEPSNLFFLEEPLPYSNPDHYAKLTASTTTPIAGGECLTSAQEWQHFIDSDSFSIGQPDASFTSGMDQFVSIASLLAMKGRKIAPHSWGAGASLMQNIHCGFACPNTSILEVAPAYGPLHSELIGESIIMKDGYILPPQKPGLGISLTEETIGKYPFKPGSGEFTSVPGKILTT